MKPKHNYKLLHIPTGNFIIVVPGICSKRKISDRLLNEWSNTQRGSNGSPKLLYGFFLGNDYLWDKADMNSVELVVHKKELLEKILNTKNFKECILMDIYGKSIADFTDMEKFNRLEFEIVEV